MTPTPGPTVVRLEAKQIPDAGHVLARAFRTDPLQTYIFPDVDENVTRSPAMFGAIVRSGVARAEVWTTAATDGIAVWRPPAREGPEDKKDDEADSDDLPALIGHAAFERFSAFFAAIEPFHHEAAPEPHWYLEILGVDPTRQGQGIGSALLQPILARADADGDACYLETANPKNVPFYVGCGFAVVVETIEPVSGLRLWTFRRDPPH
jgi:GNAT superfamily N-acetyltransferase